MKLKTFLIASILITLTSVIIAIIMSVLGTKELQLSARNREKRIAAIAAIDSVPDTTCYRISDGKLYTVPLDSIPYYDSVYSTEDCLAYRSYCVVVINGKIEKNIQHEWKDCED